MIQLLTLFLIIISVTLFGHLVPLELKIFLYSLSTSIKEVLLFIMPFIIFVLIFSSINNLKHSAMLFIILLVTAIFLSNLTSSLIAYSIGHFFVKNMQLVQGIENHQETITPMWLLHLPSLISNFHAVVCGFIFGMISSSSEKIKKLSNKMQNFILNGLKVFLPPIIPVFLLGLIVKMQHDQVLYIVFKNYSIIFLLIIFTTFLYIFLLYGIANSFQPKNWLMSIRNMIPAFITAMSTMSSNASMPLTLEGSKKNVVQHNIVSSLVPVTSSFHLVGDCFFIIIISTIMTYGHIVNYSAFILFFLLFKFAIVAVPAGGIVVMLPILEKYLFFSPEMLVLITGLYVIFDPIITSANVMGNGAFTMIFTKIYNRIC